MSPSQCRAARAFVDMTASALAKSAGLAPSMITQFEAGRHDVAAESVALMRAALETAGIDFLDDEGDGEGLRRRSGPRFQQGTRPQDLNTGNDD